MSKYTRVKESRYVAFRKANPQAANFIAPEATSAEFGLRDSLESGLGWAKQRGQQDMQRVGDAVSGVASRVGNAYANNPDIAAARAAVGGVAQRAAEDLGNARAAVTPMVENAQGAVQGAAAGVGDRATQLLDKLKRRGQAAVPAGMAMPSRRDLAIGAGVAGGVGALGVGGKMAYDRMQPEEV
jgi:hypothetical protein